MSNVERWTTEEVDDDVDVKSAHLCSYHKKACKEHIARKHKHGKTVKVNGMGENSNIVNFIHIYMCDYTQIDTHSRAMIRLFLFS